MRRKQFEHVGEEFRFDVKLVHAFHTQTRNNAFQCVSCVILVCVCVCVCLSVSVCVCERERESQC